MGNEVSDALVEKFSQVTTALVTDAFLRLGLSGWMEDVLPVSPGRHVAGRARTVAFGPTRGEGKLTSSLYAVMSNFSRGEVLVVGTGGTKDNLMGDNYMKFAQRTGLAGVITDSRTRDRIGIGELSMPVFSRGAAVRPPILVEPYDVDVAISCGGAQVRPGDLIVADDDGVVVVPAGRAADVWYQVEDLAAIEAATAKHIANGDVVAAMESQSALKKIVRV